MANYVRDTGAIAKLNPEQRRVTQLNGTELPFAAFADRIGTLVPHASGTTT
jgi:peptide methionine sulfoxide reductase MsrB